MIKTMISKIPRFSDSSQSKAGLNIVKFAALLIVITVIARGTSGMTLTRVTVASPSRGEIISGVTGNAVVSSVDSLEVYAPEGLSVNEVFVNTGQSINIGDPVLGFDIREAEEKLIREIASLDKLLLDLENLERSEPVNTFSLESAQQTLDRAYEDYNITKAQGDADVAAAQAELNELMRSQADAAATAVEADSSGVNAARRSRDRALEDRDAVFAQGAAEIAAAQAALDAVQSIESAKYDEWHSAVGDDAIADAYRAYLAAQADAAAAEAVLSAVRSRVAGSETSAQRALEDAETALFNAEQSAVAGTRNAESERSAAIERAQNSLTAAQKRAESDLLSAARRIEDAQAGLQNAQRDHSGNIAQRSATDTGNKITATTLRLDIMNREEAVYKLRELVKNDGVLYSDIKGVVSSIKNRGDVTGKDAALSFRDGAKGFEAIMTIDKDDAEMLSVGYECEVTTGRSTMFYVPTVTGIVSAITLPDDNDSVKITIKLPAGDWNEGQRIDVYAIGDRSVYTMCLPLSALRSDNTGYFVLIVETGNNVLGTENVAVRMPVNLLASDNNIAAIEGPIGGNDRVIIGSGKPVAEGDRVRIE